MNFFNKKTLFKFFRVLFISLIFLLISVLVFVLVILNLPSTQNKLAQKGIELLNDEYQANITVDKIKINWLGDLYLSGVKIKDHHAYTFITAEQIKADTDFIELIKEILSEDGFNQLNVNYFILTKPNVQVISYPGEDQDNFTLWIDKFKSKNPDPNSPEFKMNAGLEVIDGIISIQNKNLPDGEQFWLKATNWNTKVRKFYLDDDIIKAELYNMSFNAERHQEKYEVKNFTTDFQLDDKTMIFSNLSLLTESSNLYGEVKFTFENMDAFGDFSNLVNWDILLKNSDIAGKDIRYFSPDWTSNAIAHITTKASGTLNQLTLTETNLNIDKTVLNTNFLQLGDITDNKIFSVIAKNTKIQTSLNSLKTFLPKDVIKSMGEYPAKFGTINWTGDLSVNPEDIYAKGNLISQLGQLKTDLKLLNYSSERPTYSGNFNTRQFNLGKLIDQKSIGSITGDIKIAGKGFKLNQINTQIDAQLNSIEILNNTYTAMDVKGSFKDKIFDGIIDSNSANSNLDMDVVVNLQNPQTDISFDSSLTHLDLSQFGMKKGTYIEGKATGFINFSSMDDLTADVRFVNTFFNSPEKSLPFRLFEIKTELTPTGRELTINAPEYVQGQISGNYNVDDIPNMFMNGFGKIMVGYKPKKTYINKNIDFSFNFEDNFLDIFIPKLDIDGTSSLNGNYNSNDNDLMLNLSAANLQYDDISSKNINLNINTKDSLKPLQLTSSHLSIGENNFNDIDIFGIKKNDSLFVNTNVNIGKDSLEYARFKLIQTRVNNDIIVDFLPSEIKINKSNWALNQSDEKEAKFVYNVRSGEMFLDGFSFLSDDSEIAFRGQYINKNSFMVDIDTKNTEITKLIPVSVLNDYNMSGVATGLIRIQKQGEILEPDVDLTINNFTFDNYLMGDIKTNITLNTETGLYDVNSSVKNDFSKDLTITGTINNHLPKPELNLTADFNEFQMNVLGGFLTSVFSNFKGEATGKINISGAYDKPNFQGDLVLNDFGFKVDYLGTSYRVENNSQLVIENNTVSMIDINMYDENNHLISLDNGIYNIDNNYLSIDIVGKNIQVLNTTETENDLFYGNVSVDGKFSIQGLISDLQIDVLAENITNHSHVTINSSSTYSVDENTGVLRWVGLDSLQQNKKENARGLALNIDILKVTPDTQVTLIIDDNTRDEVIARGSSNNLKFALSKSGEITMDGIYEIESGSYFFRRFVDKEFKLETGSKISWTGDPYNAELDISAIYFRTVSNLGEYLYGNNSGSDSYIPSTEVELILKLSNTLAHPDITFEIALPKASSTLRDELASKLTDQDEIRYQFGSVLLFQRFISSNPIGGSLASSAYEVFLRQLLNVFNSLSPKIQFGAELVVGNEQSNIGTRIINNISYEVSPRLKVVTTLGIPIDDVNKERNLFTIDVEADWDVSKRNNGGLVLRAFSRPANFGLESYSTIGNIQSYGGGIVWKRSFNNIQELVGKKKIQKIDSTQTNKEKHSIPKSDSLIIKQAIKSNIPNVNGRRKIGKTIVSS